MQFSALNGHIATCTILVELGADVDAKNKVNSCEVMQNGEGCERLEKRRYFKIVISLKGLLPDSFDIFIGFTFLAYITTSSATKASIFFFFCSSDCFNHMI